MSLPPFTRAIHGSDKCRIPEMIMANERTLETAAFKTTENSVSWSNEIPNADLRLSLKFLVPPI